MVKGQGCEGGRDGDRDRALDHGGSSTSPPGYAAAALDDRGLGFRAHLEPHGAWKAGIDVVTALTGISRAITLPKYAHGDDAPRPNMAASLEAWLAHAPKLVTSWPELAHTYRRSLVDFAALRFSPVIVSGQALPAAGLPWFMAIYRTEAARVAMGILEAAVYFDGRLPEAFAGYARAETRFPVEYPTACSAQAWSTGAPLLFLRTLLGLEPVGNQLLVDPALPTTIERLELLDIPGRWGHVDAVGCGRINLGSPLVDLAK